jgi:hypothetical protein
LLGQTLRREQCEGCLLADFIPEEYRREAFPCQHVDAATWARIAAIPGLPEKVAERFESVAAELEAEAELEEAARKEQTAR